MGPTPDELENAALSAEERGLRVRVLLLTNPNNPLGTIYPPGIILSSIVWARNRSMHTIVDEIYALSAQESDFESVLKILHGDLRNDVRDFGAPCNAIINRDTDDAHAFPSVILIPIRCIICMR